MPQVTKEFFHLLPPYRKERHLIYEVSFFTGTNFKGVVWMILKMCRRCKGVVVYPATYCENCRDLVNKEREERAVVVNRRANKKYDAKRDPKYIRFYNSPEWKMLKDKYMADHKYKCEGKDCKEFATEVHHVDPIQTPTGWDRRLDYTNLMNVCVRCHNKQHGRFGG